MHSMNRRRFLPSKASLFASRNSTSCLYGLPAWMPVPKTTVSYPDRSILEVSFRLNTSALIFPAMYSAAFLVFPVTPVA